MNLCTRILRMIETLEFEDFYALIELWDGRADRWPSGSHAHNIAYMLRLAQDAESFLRMGDTKRSDSRKQDIRLCYAGMARKEDPSYIPTVTHYQVQVDFRA